jgi:hypothetical protein
MIFLFVYQPQLVKKVQENLSFISVRLKNNH